jgi:hypothetical protein
MQSRDKASQAWGNLCYQLCVGEEKGVLSNTISLIYRITAAYSIATTYMFKAARVAEAFVTDDQNIVHCVIVQNLVYRNGEPWMNNVYT